MTTDIGIGIVCKLAVVENRPYHVRLAKSIMGRSPYAATSMRSNGSGLPRCNPGRCGGHGLG